MKKNFIIYAPAINSKTGGAHSILETFLKSLSGNVSSEATWCFIGNIEYQNICASSNVGFLYLNLNQKWFLRIIFDFFLFKKFYLKKNEPYTVISMQNTTPALRSKDQSLTYIHQAIPFLDDFKPHPIKNLKLFLIKHFYFFFIKYGISPKSYFIVQSEWLKQLCSKRLHVPLDHFFIHRPLPNDIDITLFTKEIQAPNTFFYPSLFQPYKNHQILIDAFIAVAKKHPNKQFILELTIEAIPVLSPNNLKIVFYGMLSRSETLKKINNATAVIYPSSIESYGMPIAEAMFLKTPVLASDLPYAKELLGNSPNLFSPDKIESVIHTIETFSPNEYQEVKISKDKFQGWATVLANFLNKTAE